MGHSDGYVALRRALVQTHGPELLSEQGSDELANKVRQRLLAQGFDVRARPVAVMATLEGTWSDVEEAATAMESMGWSVTRREDVGQEERQQLIVELARWETAP